MVIQDWGVMVWACFMCDKHRCNVTQSPGGYIYEDEHRMVCHFPAEMALLGQSVIESKRHFLDFTEMIPDETQSYGMSMQKLYSAAREATESERIYNLILLEGVPPFSCTHHSKAERFEFEKSAVINGRNQLQLR